MSLNCAAGSQSGLGVMWKTVSEDCNLACDYCYYSTCGGKPGPAINRIDSFVLDKFIQDYMRHSSGSATFAWQGGEPLLAGHEFFEEVVYRQALHAPPHTVISNSLQTNATLISGRWAAFFKTYHFLIGVSLDGPQQIHDSRRVNAAGKGSYSQVMNGIGHLRRHQVDFNILTVIHKGNVGKARELMAFYREQDFRFIQFIPCMDFRAQQVDQPGNMKFQRTNTGSSCVKPSTNGIRTASPKYRYGSSIICSASTWAGKRNPVYTALHVLQAWCWSRTGTPSPAISTSMRSGRSATLPKIPLRICLPIPTLGGSTG